MGDQQIEDYATLAGGSIDLDAIKARLSAITPRYWVAGVDLDERDTYWSGDAVYAVDELPVPMSIDTGDDAVDEERSYEVSAWDDDHCRGHVCDTHNYFSIPDEQHDANQRLIAHAPTDLAALLAHVDDLRGVLEEAITVLREVWTAGSAEGRLSDLWNLAGRADLVLDPASNPIFMPVHSSQPGSSTLPQPEAP